MAAYAALVSLMNNIEQIINHPHLSTSLDKKQIQPLLEKSGFLLDFIEGYNYRGGGNEAEDLERRIASAAHAAEDAIESHIVDQIHAGSNEVSDKGSLDLQQIIEDMDTIMEKAAKMKEKHGLKEKQATHSRPLMETGETVMVGLDDELSQLLDELTGQQSSRRIISVVGMGGMGKTTLAKNVYQNLLIKQHFDIRAWATISQQYNVEEIFSQLLSSQGNFTSTTVDSLGEKLHKTLSGRRYLVILDDLWSVKVWDKVGRYFPDNNNGSRIVLTTRLSNVAIDCGSSCFKMNFLDEDKSWELFCEKAFQHEDCPPQLEDVGKEIVKLCKGLPLSIAVIGGLLLKSPRNVGYWMNVARDIKSIPNSKEKQQTLHVLSLSYSHLPPHLKPCFLYMGVFKEDSEIRVSKIIKLWVAEGFLKSNGAQISEEIAEGYLKDLIDRNLILVSKRRHNGKIGSCGIHDLLRDLCLKVAEQTEFFHVTNCEIRGTERRLVCNTFSCPKGGLTLARSIITSTILYPVKHRLLRVLDEDHHYSPVELFGNVNLRYLAYGNPRYSSTWAALPQWELPTSVSLLWNLQTLMIRASRTSAVVVAPIEIWKMRQLRHVECHHIHLPDPPIQDDDLFVLENLLTLKTAVNLRLCEEVCKIIPNIKKLGVVYHGELKGYDDSLIECLCNFDRLHKLESLNISIHTIKWGTRVIELSKKLRFPSLLNKLSLTNCLLYWDDLTMIGSLPQLQVLNLEFFSHFFEQRWRPIDGQFLRLKFLKLEHCQLKYWDAESSHFPVLEKLFLHHLYFLEEIPSAIGEIATLELIHVDWCSNSAAISAMKIKEDQLESQGNDGLQIQVKINKSHMKDFKEMMETEGLTITNIQLEIQ